MKRTITRRLIVRVVLGAIPIILGCGGDNGTGPASVAGQYSLQTVNGAPLPFIEIQQGTTKIELISDAITVTDSGTWTEQFTERTTINGQVTTDTGTDAGTYTRSGTAVSFKTNSDGSIMNGTISNGVFTFVASGLTLVYQKQ